MLLRDCNGVNAPVLMLASDLGPATPNPAGSGPFALRQLLAGAASADARATGGTALTVGVWVAAAEAPAPTPLPGPSVDTPAWPPVSTWTDVTAHGLRGDGTTDNTAALESLLLAPPTPALYFPTGVYAFRPPSSGIRLGPPAAAASGASGSSSGVHLFGLHPWDVVLTLADNVPSFMNPEAVSPFFYTAPSTGTSGSGEVWVSGLNIRTGSSVGQPQPPPVPAGWTNPNPGALALLWAAEAGGVQDVFFHPNSWPDNHRLGNGSNTEVSLLVAGTSQGSWRSGGSFSDIWSCNAYAKAGVVVENSAASILFQQLSSEHHAGHELWLVNASRVSVHCMQTEDRSPDAAPTASIFAEAGSEADVTGLFSYYAANVSSAAAVTVDATSSMNVSVFRQYHSYHPMFYNCSLLAQNAAGRASSCIKSTDYASVFSGPPPSQ